MGVVAHHQAEDLGVSSSFFPDLFSRIVSIEDRRVFESCIGVELSHDNVTINHPACIKIS